MRVKFRMIFGLDASHSGELRRLAGESNWVAASGFSLSLIIPLHVKSHYSLGYGTASLESLVERAAALGLPALALTDLENLYGQVRFHELCRSRGIRPITGVELRPGFDGGAQIGTRSGRLILLARDEAGYRRICRIVSRRRGGVGTPTEREEARDPVRAVAGNPQGLFILTDDPGVLARLLARRDLDPSQIRMLLVRPSPASAETAIREAARRHGIGLVADPEVVVLERSDHPLHVLQRAIRLNRPASHMSGTRQVEPTDLWFRSEAEMRRLFADAPEAAAEAERIAEHCRFELKSLEARFPTAHGAGSPDIALQRRCEDALRGARSEGRLHVRVYNDRLAYELTTIRHLGLSGYLMVVAAMVDGARERGIPVAVRGSAVGSLAVHLLGISEVDPLRNGLYFERFLHMGRRAPPDVDLEVCSERRDELIRWIRRRFGKGRVTMTGAHHTFQLRSALKLGLKAFGATRSQLERITAQLSLPPGADPSGADGEAFDIEELPLERLTPTQRSALPLVLRLIGKPRLLALHPGGLVLADPAIEAYMPVENAPRGLSVAQYDADSIERIGLVKIDLLGSRFLTQLAETVELVKGRHVELESGREEVLRDRREIDLDDPSTLARLDRADTIGCFQVETPAVRALLERLRIGSVEDCVAALALVRPGAAAGATKRDYVLRARGDRRLEARHPLIASRLRNTLGLLIYDEDLMTLLSATAGISLGAADEIRSQIIDAGRDHERLSELERRFLRLARRAGSDSDLATTVWKEVLRFAAYSFSKAHAWSYALMAYQSAYLKTHHPVEFACALLNSYGGAYPLRTIAADLQRSGVPLLGPTVNASAIRATVVPNGSAVDGAVRVGLSRVKHLTRKSAGMILASRQDRGPFRDFGDLLERIRLSRREIEALVLCGACDDLPPLSGAGYPFLHEAALKGLRGELSPAAFERIAAAGVEADAAGDATAGERLATYRSLVRIRNELRFLDLHLSDHPMHVLRAAARAQGCLSSSEIRAGWSAHDADRVRFAGIIAASRPHTLGKREAMQYVTFEDEEGLLEAVIPPPLYRRLAGQLTTPGPYLVEGRPSEDLGHLQLIVCALSPFHERERAGPTDARRGEAANG